MMHKSVKARIDALTAEQMNSLLWRRPGDEPATDEEMRQTIRELYRLGALEFDAIKAVAIFRKAG